MVVVAAITSPVRFAAILHRTLAQIDTPMTLDIEFVQVPVLLCAVELQIISIVLILIIQVACRAIEELVTEGMLVDIVPLHPLMVEEGVAVGHLVEVLMGLDLVLGQSEEKA